MSNDVIATTRHWSSGEATALARIARLIVGEDTSGVMPPVDDERLLPALLDRAVDFEAPIRRGLATLDALASEQGNVIGLEDEALASLMETHRELRSLLRAMMQVVAQCYYEDERVLRALDLEARPPFPSGHHVEPGDWSLLEPVKQGPPRYRDANSND